MVVSKSANGHGYMGTSRERDGLENVQRQTNIYRHLVGIEKSSEKCTREPVKEQLIILLQRTEGYRPGGKGSLGRIVSYTSRERWRFRV